MRRICKSCPKKPACKKICKSIERKLDKLHHKDRAEFAVMDREVVWSIQDVEESLPEPDKTVARLYFRFGMNQEKIAAELAIARSSVGWIVARILKRKRG